MSSCGRGLNAGESQEINYEAQKANPLDTKRLSKEPVHQAQKPTRLLDSKRKTRRSEKGSKQLCVRTRRRGERECARGTVVSRKESVVPDKEGIDASSGTL